MSDELAKSKSGVKPPRNARAVPIETEEIGEILAKGGMHVQGLVPWSSNYTFLVQIALGSRQVLAVYKPVRGERPLWDFPSGTLAKREYAAYLVSAALGWPHVPPTVIRDGPQGLGAVQYYVETVEDEHYFTLLNRYRDEMKRVAVFDAVVNNTDRKGGHVLLGKDGNIWCIDHGVTFHEHPKLRTVIWDFTQEQIPSNLLEDLRKLRSSIEGSGQLARMLSPLLSNREIDALCRRVNELLTTGTFPEPPDDWPHIPWPPI